MSNRKQDDRNPTNNRQQPPPRAPPQPPQYPTQIPALVSDSDEEYFTAPSTNEFWYSSQSIAGFRPGAVAGRGRSVPSIPEPPPPPAIINPIPRASAGPAAVEEPPEHLPPPASRPYRGATAPAEPSKDVIQATSPTATTTTESVDRMELRDTSTSDPNESSTVPRPKKLKHKAQQRNQMESRSTSSEEAMEQSRKVVLFANETPSDTPAQEIETKKENEDTKSAEADQVSEKRKSGSSLTSYDEEEEFIKRIQLEEQLRTNLQQGNAFIYMVMPPDGGYGWFIVLISFLCQVIVDGIIFSIGILLPYMARDFNVSNEEVVLIASIQIGPISTAFINKYGFRPVAYMGTISAFASLTTASFCHNFALMLFFYSIIGAVGLCMIWVSSQLIIGYYFERYRPIANGISCAGAGAGILLFCYMNSQIVDEYDWRITSRVHMGFLCCIAIMAASYIEVPPTRIARVVENREEETTETEDEVEVGNTLAKIQYSKHYSVHYNLNMPEEKNIERDIEQMLVSYSQEELRNARKPCWCCECCYRFTSKDSSMDLQTKRYVIQVDPVQRNTLFYTGPADYDQATASRTSMRIVGQTAELDPEMKKEINYGLSTMNIDRTQRPARRRSLKQLRRTTKYPLLAYISPKNWMHPKLKAAFNMLFDFKLLRIMEFRILVVSAFLFPMGFNIPFVYSKARAELPLFHKNLIGPAIGFSNFLFRIISGFVAFKYRQHTTYICGYGIIFGGLAVLVSAYYGENLIWFQYTYAMCYGVAPAFYSTLRAIIYVRVVGLEKLTNAFGITVLAMGLGVFVGTTLAAILNEHTGSYSAAFAFSGFCLITSGVLKVILPTLTKRRNNNATK